MSVCFLVITGASFRHYTAALNWSVKSRIQDPRATGVLYPEGEEVYIVVQNPDNHELLLVTATDNRFVVQHAAHLSTEVSEKALYVISALVSSNYEGQQQFHSNKGVSVIRSLLANELSTRQHRKVLNLITDLTDVDGEIEVKCLLCYFKGNINSL